MGEACRRSNGRLFCLGIFDPRAADASLEALEQAARGPAFVGLKIHPSIHRVGADDRAYEGAWQFAAEHDLPILTHSWSVSETNPVQRYSTPERFEAFVRRFPQVRLVLAMSGGRGSGRHEAIRMVNEHPNVFLDFAGDIFCYRLIETLVERPGRRKYSSAPISRGSTPGPTCRAFCLADVDDRLKAEDSLWTTH